MSVHSLLKIIVVEEKIAKKFFLLGALPSHLFVLGVTKASSPSSVAGSRSLCKPQHTHQPRGHLCLREAVPGRSSHNSLLLAEVCSAAAIQAGQIQSFLCEHRSSKLMECRRCLKAHRSAVYKLKSLKGRRTSPCTHPLTLRGPPSPPEALEVYTPCFLNLHV